MTSSRVFLIRKKAYVCLKLLNLSSSLKSVLIFWRMSSTGCSGVMKLYKYLKSALRVKSVVSSCSLKLGQNTPFVSLLVKLTSSVSTMMMSFSLRPPSPVRTSRFLT